MRRNGIQNKLQINNNLSVIYLFCINEHKASLHENKICQLLCEPSCTFCYSLVKSTDGPPVLHTNRKGTGSYQTLAVRQGPGRGPAHLLVEGGTGVRRVWVSREWPITSSVVRLSSRSRSARSTSSRPGPGAGEGGEAALAGERAGERGGDRVGEWAGGRTGERAEEWDGEWTGERVGERAGDRITLSGADAPSSGLDLKTANTDNRH